MTQTNALHQHELNDELYREIDDDLFFAGDSQAFRVYDLDSANWVFRKLQALNAKVGEINTLADKEVDRIRDWQAKETAGIAGHIAFFERLLTQYHESQIAQDPKAKTISTPYGKLKSTTRKAAPKKTDDAALLQHLKDSGETDYIVVKETPAWGDYKKTLQVAEVNGIATVRDANGQEVPGVEVEPAGTSFKVEVAE